MSALSSALRNVTLLDITLPGTHDSMTYDLGFSVSDNSNDMPRWLADLLHWVPKDHLTEFVRDQAVTNVLSMQQQLQAGIRFIDFRIVWTQGKAGGYDWYCLHTLQTRHKAMYYLTQLQEFLTANPSEVVFLWITKHSSSCGKLDGTPQQQRGLWSKIESLFGGLLFDHQTHSLNTTTFGEMWRTGQRLVVSTADHASFTGSSRLALDACRRMVVSDPPTGVMNETHTQEVQLRQLSEAVELRRQYKSQGKMWIAFWSTSTPTSQIIAQAALSFNPLLDSRSRARIRQACANSFNIPGSLFCPATLLEVVSLSNYYTARVLNYALQTSSVLPNVVYGGYLLQDGLQNTSDTSSYAFVASIVQNSLLALGSSSEAMLARIAANNVTQVYNVTTGRISDWPKF